MPRNLVAGITMRFDPPSLVRIWKLQLFPAIFAAHLEVAMQESVDLMAAVASGLFIPQPGNDQSGGRSTGALMSSVHGDVITPFRGEVSTGDLPYAQRVEYGFSGMTDSLGRKYAYWPSALYFTQTVDYTIQDVADFFSLAIDDVVIEMAL